ncbi:polyadenylate-binding protein-interacting protein 4 isoform X2 [Iris pallida]|uniref:Polyadenylate-binding protein-interacting protein 4 isoform X2 n=1 Tax=Iris pallida TaxID=29817 RepID=A0AAX6HGB7_IRIPA|nr:polyadenylate-binding protein-interacting protein 4 isoform X2 [Iris pallida]
MNLQNNIQPRSSINSFGRRRVDRDTGPRPDTRMHSGKPASGSFGTSGGLTNPSRDRLIYVMTSLIGLPVDVHIRNGSIISGIFHATNAEKDFGIVLKMAQIIKDGSARGQKSVPDTVKKPRDMFIQSKDLVQVVAKDVPLTIEEFSNGNAHERRTDLMIDSAISHSRHLEAERELERWTPDVDDPGCPELENIFDGTWNRNWDQFETNEALFGVKSTFDEELYTTKLERGPRTRELELKASRLAREIEGEDTNDLHLAEERGMQFHEDFDFDEEIRYSAVKREVDDSGFEESDISFLDACNDETFGTSHGSAIQISYSDVARNKYVNKGPTSSSLLSMDEESSRKVHSDMEARHSSSNIHVKPVTSDFVAKSSLFFKEEIRLEEKQTNDRDEEKDFLNGCTERTLPEVAQTSKFIEVQSLQTSIDAKQRSPGTDAYDSSSAGLESKPSIGESSEAAFSADSVAASEPVDPALRTGISKSSTSERIGAGRASGATGLSPSSSLGSLSSEKSTLNPNAKEFKLNPNAKSFTPSASFRTSVPMSEVPFFYGGNLSAIPPMHSVSMGIGIGPSFGGPQPVYNPQAAQAYVHPNGPLYGQQMIVGQPRPVYYMPTYPPEMQYKGRDH